MTESFNDTNYIFYTVYGIIFFFLIAGIIVMISLTIYYSSQLSTLESNQSPSCYSIYCPCDKETNAPCYGYASRKVDSNFQCSNAPNTLIQPNGKPVT